jgi:DNA integrity scanning protein DisA with diadenylate cyclase activity
MIVKKEQVLMASAIELARTVDAIAILSFLDSMPAEAEIPVIWVKEHQPDLMIKKNMQELLEFCEHHILDAVVQYHLRTGISSGTIIGVFPFAILIYDVGEGRDYLDLISYRDIVAPEILHSALTLALEIAHEGREGRNIGTAFIIGDGSSLLARSHQAILNPYAGHPLSVCDIRNRENWESVKEFAQLDGVFIITKEGYIAAAGRYIDADSRGVSLPSGLGGRHMATAAITRDVPSVGITVSESGGLIRVFRDGTCRLTLRSEVVLTR